MPPKQSVLLVTDGMPVAELDAYGNRLESLGYDMLWVPEIGGREPFATCAHLLARTDRIKVGTGIANVYVRDAVAAAQGRHTLAELSGGRFTLGLGVSHPPLVEPRGHQWEMPVPKMRSYLHGIAETEVDAPAPPRAAPIIVAAHGPKLLKLASEQADGAFMYLMPPEYVREGRRILGPDKELHVAMRCCFMEDADRARAMARQGLSFYIGLPAYHRVWKSIGFDDPDFANGGSDRLLDSVITWGDEKRLRERIEAYGDAGASHVVLAPIHPEEEKNPARAAGVGIDWSCLEALAPV
jgi:probable F420-dependent oxidoreductase